MQGNGYLLKFCLICLLSDQGEKVYIEQKSPADEELKLMPERLKLFGDAILSFSSIGPDRTMNTYNGK